MSDPRGGLSAGAAPRHWIALFVTVCLVALNMRMTITGVGPLLDEIAASQGTTPAALGLLASIPLIAWGLVSPLAHGLATRIGTDAAVAWSLLVLAAGTVWRSLPGPSLNLWLGTCLIGAALAVANVLLPVTIRRDFGSRIPLVMGVYSALLGGAAAISAGLVVPISRLAPAGGESLGWRIALLASGLVVPIALVAWAVTHRRGILGGRGAARAATGAETPSDEQVGRRIWRDPLAWWIAIYMGMQSWNFYVFATWLAPIELSRSVPPVAAGIDVMLFHVCGVLGSLAAPFLARTRLRAILPIVPPILCVIGSVGIVLLPDAVPALWLALAGLSCGSALSISLTLMAQRAASHAASSALSGMAQSVGYLLAGLGPILFGLAHELTGGWLLPLAVVLLASATGIVAGLAVRGERRVLDPR
ncbi:MULTISPECIES: MFS transporter [unclassified Leucobacter]|uniref:MFS transporter n=1 Tax=unclassified Leucobacter TaxID=2621730 RepID=UPI000621390A|nr:MFS transporter [Leucobacter sp. Ag1]KKI21682.1 hypothetical protein XM48_04395 [Leucobacter sp. Ag1]